MEIIKIKGKINKITYRNADNWAVFSVQAIPDDISCTGILPSMCDSGFSVECEGVWTQGKYGKQLKCKTVAPVAPDTNSKSGVISLLCLLPNIGKVKATAAVEELGPEMAWKMAQECPSYLGVTTVDKSLEIQEKAKGLVSNYKATTYLLGIGLTENQTNKIIKRYGINEAITQIQTDPYQLINDIDGFGFRIVDGISLKAGLKSDSEQRILACISFCLDDSEKNNGNIWIYGGALVKMVINELVDSAMVQNQPIKPPEYCTVKKLIQRLAAAKKVIIDKNKIYSANLFNCERIIYNAIKGEI